MDITFEGSENTISYLHILVLTQRGN